MHSADPAFEEFTSIDYWPSGDLPRHWQGQWTHSRTPNAPLITKGESVATVTPCICVIAAANVFRPHALARRPRPGLLLTLIPGRTPEANSPSPEYRRVHAAGASPPPYDQPHHHRTEAPAFTRRERHLHPTCGPPSCEKPPRSRGGSLTFTLTTSPATIHRKPPRSRGGSVTFTLRRPGHDRKAAPAFTRRSIQRASNPARCRVDAQVRGDV